MAEQIVNQSFDIHDQDDTIGGRISRARDALELSTAQLARRLGVKTETVQAWENDRSEPRSNRVIMLAGMLGVSPTWLLTGIGELPSTPAVNSELHVMMTQLSKLKRAHASMGKMIDTLEQEAERMSRQLENQ
ncbi:helix-turn-helix domain-containing protein [Hoeflea sp. WL0058]|uniref:Helix-turn-helix domain-containing protein n=1 Tax=Flavimaribacter sediminis TaxID=2865987 RepID=A0AAE3D3T3_9HYPH|nr:helix-turn-helix domain-containing protein [Flavimaribacter sediminis]MBW8640417.1 helix-turn-helix domain-containing protein [Flavimaribacter sediminis]